MQGRTHYVCHTHIAYAVPEMKPHGRSFRRGRGLSFRTNRHPDGAFISGEGLFGGGGGVFLGNRVFVLVAGLVRGTFPKLKAYSDLCFHFSFANKDLKLA